MVSTGFLIVADITGYTAFLTDSELEHAQEILNELFHAQLRYFQPPLTANSFHGDAILGHLPDGALIQGQSLLELVERIYTAFTELREGMAINSDCDCRACRNIPYLDLKFFIHHGQYLQQKMADREELVGPDVILVHRMMKNRVKEATGVSAYALLTAAAADALQLGDLRNEMLPHSETYEHIGAVPMWVHDLRARYEEYRAHRRVLITPEEADITFDVDVPVAQTVAWDYLADITRKRRWSDLESITRTDGLGGRIRNGASFHCAHRTGDLRYTILDWRPLDYYTTEGVGLKNTRYRSTYRLLPTETGCRFVYTWYFPQGIDAEVLEEYRAVMGEAAQRLRRQIIDEWATSVPEPALARAVAREAIPAI